ncbi:MAG: SDR family NAD(P)-dependent oxidoreductase [Rhodoplanes sp.]
MDLANKTAMITGAVGNLGTAVSTGLKAAGAKTIVVDRSRERLEQIYKSGPECLLAGNADLTSEESVGKVVASALKHFGRIDALINTVGGFRGGKAAHEEDLSTWDMMMMVNLRTTVLMCRAVIPAMLANGAGSIVNVSAGAALSGPPGLAAYSASKAAVLRFTESLAAEVKASGIRVNAVLPGTIDTPQNRQAMPDADVSAFVKPEAIADVIAFFVSDASRAVTGVALPVFGRG